jgi:ADP-ribose pyrophosphatase YjhB (NUDIX family)
MHRVVLAVWSLLPTSAQRFVGDLLHGRVTVGVCAIILRHGTHVLLAQHTYKQPAWQLPGGYVDRGEQPSAALACELREELGFHIGTCRLVHAERERPHHLTLYYVVEASGTFRPSAEISSLRPWPLDALPATLPADQRRALLLATSPDS